MKKILIIGITLFISFILLDIQYEKERLFIKKVEHELIMLHSKQDKINQANQLSADLSHAYGLPYKKDFLKANKDKKQEIQNEIKIIENALLKINNDFIITKMRYREDFKSRLAVLKQNYHL